MQKKKLNIPVYIYFIILTVLVIVLYPKEEKFKYTFTEGKPWKYGLLTAPFDFPIYKSKEDVKKEQDSIIQNYQPYFQINRSIAEKQKENFRKDYRNSLYHKMNYRYFQYIENTLQQIYKVGIVPMADYTFLMEEHYKEFMVIENNNVAEPRISTDIFTVKSAYSYFFDNCPSDLSIEDLRVGDLNKYLSENLKYDKETSEKVKEELLRKVSPASGMVQAGQKIVDRGEIVDDKTFVILNSLKQVSESRQGTVERQGWSFVGTFILITVFIFCFLLYLYFFRTKIYYRKKDVLFLICLIGLFTILTELGVNYNLFNIYIIPYAMIPIAIRTFFDSRTARTAHNTTTLLCALMVPFPSEFLFLQFVTSMVVIFSLKDLSNRFQLIRCSFYVLSTYIIVYLGLALYQEGDWSKIDWRMFIYFGINFIFLMFTYSFIYIIERIFGYTSSVSLVELSDINLPLLRELSETSPGTFQHSLQVSILGSAAADKIGANPLLVRTGALYHDIGKMKNPAFFTENQVGDVSPHNSLSYEKSAQIIIQHVSEGVKIAEKNNIPNAIIDFIRTHHGKGRAKYFYNSYKNEFPDTPIDISKFTYPGPNPFSKETAILMMADSVEAASRSLKEYTEESITALVNKIIDSQIEDGLLNDTPLTFRNIQTVKSVFIEKLITMFHSRISYPELETKN